MIFDILKGLFSLNVVGTFKGNGPFCFVNYMVACLERWQR